MQACRTAWVGPSHSMLPQVPGHSHCPSCPPLAPLINALPLPFSPPSQQPHLLTLIPSSPPSPKPNHTSHALACRVFTSGMFTLAQTSLSGMCSVAQALYPSIPLRGASYEDIAVSLVKALQSGTDNPSTWMRPGGCSFQSADRCVDKQAAGGCAAGARGCAGKGWQGQYCCTWAHSTGTASDQHA